MSAGDKGKQDRTLSHVDAQNRPTMVDVSAKAATVRSATAEAWMELASEVSAVLQEGELQTKKGPVFHTAIIAGTQAAKQTSTLIPFCHPLPLDGIRISLTPVSDGRRLHIVAEVKTTARTGVEMEALTAASVAALTVYDMTKALSPETVIGPIRVIRKTGGKRDFGATGSA